MTRTDRRSPRHAERRTEPGHGRIVWRRFALVVVPGVLALSALAWGTAAGAVPVALALEGEQSVKVTAGRLNSEAFGTLPSFVQDRDGTRRPVLVVDLRRLEIEGLCASTVADTPVGRYVLRMETPPGARITAGDVQFAIEIVDGLGAMGETLGINREQTAPDGTWYAGFDEAGVPREGQTADGRSFAIATDGDSSVYTFRTGRTLRFSGPDLVEVTDTPPIRAGRTGGPSTGPVDAARAAAAAPRSRGTTSARAAGSRPRSSRPTAPPPATDRAAGSRPGDGRRMRPGRSDPPGPHRVSPVRRPAGPPGRTTSRSCASAPRGRNPVHPTSFRRRRRSRRGTRRRPSRR